MQGGGARAASCHAGTLTLAVLRPVPGGREMPQTADELDRSPQAEDALERVRSPPALARRGTPRPARAPPGTAPPAGATRPARLPQTRDIRVGRRPHACPIERERERGADRARHRDARRPRLHALRRGDPPLRLHAGATARPWTTSSASWSARLRGLRGPGGHARRPQPAAPASRCSAIGSHCDSNRNGGKYDGTMGVVTALEVCRLNEELGLGLPLQLISFLEEEGSGFGQMLLGSRIMRSA